MIFSKIKKILTGLYIDRESIKIAQIIREKATWRLLQCQSIPLPDMTLKLSYKAKNIISSQQFTETVNSIFKTADNRVCYCEKTPEIYNKLEKLIDSGYISYLYKKIIKMTGSDIFHIGLSVPNEIVKLQIQDFSALPKSQHDTKKMVAWKTEKSLLLSAKKTIISHDIIGENFQGNKRLLVSVGMKDVILDLEKNLMKLKIFSKIIRPACINQLNFYIQALPAKGTIAFIGLFEYFFAFFIFENAQLAFYQGVKKGFSDLHFFQDVDIIMSHYQRENTNKKIDQLYIASHVGYHKELKEVFQNISSIDVVVMDENNFIKTDKNFFAQNSKDHLSHYVAAIGAAQSLVL